MWRATNDDGTLTYSFVEALNATYPYFLVRLLGGVVVLAGMFLMALNVWKTYAQGQAVAADQPVLAPDPSQSIAAVAQARAGGQA